jgi:hypothetical protein
MERPRTCYDVFRAPFDLDARMRDTVAAAQRASDIHGVAAARRDFHDALEHIRMNWDLRSWYTFALGADWYGALWQEWESRFTGEIPRTYVSRDSLGWFLGTECGAYDCDEFESVAGAL